ELIRGAQRNIKIMLYQARFYEDYPGSDSNMLCDELVAAHKRGVHVMAVIDISDWNPENSEFNKDYAERLASGGCEVYLDDPNITSHQKVMLVDDWVTLIGSVNWSHYAFNKNNEAAVVIWSAQVNAGLTEYFNDMMAASKRYLSPKYDPTKDVSGVTGEAAKEKTLTPVANAEVELLANRDYFPGVKNALLHAKKRVWVVQAQAIYYTSVPGHATRQQRMPGEAISQTNLLFDDLVIAHNRGVEVNVLLDLSDRFPEDNLDFERRLAQKGITVYQDFPATQTHTKMLVIDDDKVVVGSTNWTYFALEEGNEASVLIQSPVIAQHYLQYIDDLLKTSTRYELPAELRDKMDSNESVPSPGAD
ncbi:MAG: phospholipase D-like domain-containing protein, partial [bacterium]